MLLVCLALLMLLSAMGCTVTALTDTAPGSPASAQIPIGSGWPVIPAPVLMFEDYELPPSCFVTDLDDRRAIYEQSLNQHYPDAAFGIVDMKSGEHFTLLETPVNARQRYSMFSPRISGDLIAWEEVSPNESTAPDDAQWRLYAARVDWKTRSIGVPVLVDYGNTGKVARPFYGFDENALVWSRSTDRSFVGTESASRSSLLRRDLSSNDVVTVFRSVRGWKAVCVDGDATLLTETRESQQGSERLVIIDSVTGERHRTFSLPQSQRAAHFARSFDNLLVYSAFDDENQPWPSLYAVEPEGTVTLVCRNALDPVSFGPWMLFERIVLSRGQGGVSEVGCLAGLSADSRTIFVHDQAPSGFWQTPMSASTHSQQDRMAVTLDLAPYVEDSRDAMSVVRIYRIR